MTIAPISPKHHLTEEQLKALSVQIKAWAKELGFQQAAISDVELGEHENHLKSWLAKNFHGEMNYMASHGNKRSRPAELLPGTLRSISLRMDYLNKEQPRARDFIKHKQNGRQAYVARYALGRDYHKLIRKRLQKLANRIEGEIGSFGYRAFVDSAPVLERALAEKAGLGWIGKNTMLINRQAGSWYFLAEIFTDLPLPCDKATDAHCGTCQACIDLCPTKAIVAPYQLDARKCISYLTIEHKGSIPVELRPHLGNRIYGCDDCQLVCPWNRYAQVSQEGDYQARHQLDNTGLLELFNWSEEEFLEKTAGSAIRRTGYIGWLRNIAVALGNANYDTESYPGIISALQSKTEHPEPIVSEHAQWALEKQFEKQAGQ